MSNIIAKKPLKLPTNTNYFDPELSKSSNTFANPRTYQSRQCKIEGYETRLYWQFRYCLDHNGQTFFYTLTYNDAHMPKFYGENCFDYEDLRDLLTGGFRKQLLRKYGTAFKYFIGAELGDGKGERGMHNNPHYHILFFLEDAHNHRFPYKKISPKDFRHLVRMYWQGFDEDVDGFQDYRTALYGIAREGENDGLVTDFRACMYCAKYVTKDVKLVQREHHVYHCIWEDLYTQYLDSEECYKDFFHDFIKERYDGKGLTDRELAKSLCGLDPDDFELKHRIAHFGTIAAPYYEGLDEYAWIVPSILSHLDIWTEYRLYASSHTNDKVKEAMNEYRNRYCNKCRISHGVGDYAFQHPGYDKMSGTIQVPSKKGFKERPISLYYFRKIFTDTIVMEGSPRYILNEDGVKYQLSRFAERVERLRVKADSNLRFLLNSKELYDKITKSDLNTKVFMHYGSFLENIHYLLEENNIDNILQDYAYYKLVYEDRQYSVPRFGDSLSSYYPPIDPFNDYRRFITTITYRRSPFGRSSFMQDPDTNYVSYQCHPYFLRYIGLFDLLDLCSDYFFIQEDDRRQKDAEERAAVKRFHDRAKLKEFYGRFGI